MQGGLLLKLIPAVAVNVPAVIDDRTNQPRGRAAMPRDAVSARATDLLFFFGRRHRAGYRPAGRPCNDVFRGRRAVRTHGARRADNGAPE
jgi:hypothetical protein